MRQRGFSLVEFMIAITIGLFLIAGLVYLIAETSRSRAEMERSSRQIESGRYALDRIAEDLRHAAFYGEYIRLAEETLPPTTAAAAPCGVAIAELLAGLPLGVQAYDGVASWSSLPAEIQACVLEPDYQPNTDILVVRRASTSAICPPAKICTAGTPAGTPVPNQPYIQTTPNEKTLDLGSNLAAFTLTHPAVNTTDTVYAPLHRYIVRIYFVSQCNVPASGAVVCNAGADGGSPIPTLKMLELGVNPITSAGPAFQKLAIAEGIEQLQFDFGIDNDPAAINLATGYVGDGVADGNFVECAACSTTQWSNVVAAGINLVARNTERSPGYSDDKTYVLGLRYPAGAPYVPAAGVKGHRRHAYSMFVRLKNVSMRRE